MWRGSSMNFSMNTRSSPNEAHRDRAQRHGGQVRDQPLLAVEAQDGDRVARAHAQRMQAERDFEVIEPTFFTTSRNTQSGFFCVRSTPTTAAR